MYNITNNRVSVFKLLMAEIPLSQPLIAVDYFGAGSSDECACNETVDEFVPYTQFAQWVLELCDAAGARKLIPMGSLTGASPAMELAWLAAKQGRAHALVQFEAFWLSPKAKAYIDSIYCAVLPHSSHRRCLQERYDTIPIVPRSIAFTVPYPYDIDQ